MESKNRENRVATKKKEQLQILRKRKKLITLKLQKIKIRAYSIFRSMSKKSKRKTN